MFNLEHAISKWRAQLEGLPADVVEELENHLRDEIARQIGAGADAEAALATAVRLLGDSAELQQEFAKANGPKQADMARPHRWARNISFAAALFIVAINTWALIEFELSRFETVIGACAIAVTGLYVACAPFLRTWLPRPAHARLAPAMKIAVNIAALLPVILLLSVMNVIQFESGPLVTMLIFLFLAGVASSVLAMELGRGRKPGGEGAGGSGNQPDPNLPPTLTGPALGMTAGSPAIPIPSSRLAVDSRELLEVARQEAALLGHDFIGTEHVLLGLLKVAKGAVASLLTGSKVCFEPVRQEVERLIAPQKALLANADIPLTPRARKALQIAGKEAVRLRQPFVTADHVLLGLILEGSGVGALILKKMGIRADQIRKAITAGG